jgi:Flp pilus assembly protein TadG
LPGRRDRGASAVEFALILPVLTVLIFGLIDFGFVFSQQISLNNGARDASRAGVVQTLTGTALTCGSIASQARSTMAGTLGLSGASPTAIGVTVTGPAGSCSMAAGSTSQTGSTTVTPCTGATSGSQLTVALVFLSQSPVPAGPFTSMSLSASGRFACEYQ